MSVMFTKNGFRAKLMSIDMSKHITNQRNVIVTKNSSGKSSLKVQKSVFH